MYKCRCYSGNTRNTYNHTSVAFDAHKQSFRTIEHTAGHSDTVAFLEVGHIRLKIYQLFVLRTGHGDKILHLLGRYDQRLFCLMIHDVSDR